MMLAILYGMLPTLLRVLPHARECPVQRLKLVMQLERSQQTNSELLHRLAEIKRCKSVNQEESFKLFSEWAPFKIMLLLYVLFSAY